MKSSNPSTIKFDGRMDALERILAQEFPKIPGMLRYLDEFDSVPKSLTNFDREDLFFVKNNGRNSKVDFSNFPGPVRRFAKLLFYYLATNDYNISTACGYIGSLNGVDVNLICDILLSGPSSVKQHWKILVASYPEKFGLFPALKAGLVFLAQYNLAGWSIDYLDFIRTTLPFPWYDTYAGIRTGDAFLSVQDEANLVAYFTDIKARQLDPSEQVPIKLLESTCMLICSYLFGVRPIQIALISMRDIRVWEKLEDQKTAVHITFQMVKQRNKSRAFPLTRRVNQEWVMLFVELYKIRKLNGAVGDDRFFEVASAHEVGAIIIKLARSIIRRNVSATDLRHTAAQRLVDSGANQEEVAEFMGHSDLRTCLVYYTTSPTQAERVNKALGISPIYQQIVKIAHDKFISPKELARLKGDQQIAGVPHGIAITGIGGCSTGQPSCPYNPITSCYACPKFLPVYDIELHKKVLVDLRCVVMYFEKASRAEGNSPAFMQLNRTISQVQAVINELEVSNA